MKEKDVLVDYKAHQMILYVEKEDNSFGAVQTGSYMEKNYLDDYFEKKIKYEKQLIIELIDNKISPIYFYMMINDMTVTDLAARVSMSKYRVKRHLKTQYFGNVKLKHLKKYAMVFDIAVSNFFQIIKPSKMEIAEQKMTNISDDYIEQEKSLNPYIVITKIVKKENE